MAKKIKFSLEMDNEVRVRTLDELRANFSLEKVLEYYINGKLVTWLRDRYYNEIADKIEKISSEDKDLNKKICEVFNVEYTFENINLSEIKNREKKIEQLKNYVDYTKYLEIINDIAFTQEELCMIINKKSQDEKKKVYLCGEKFEINDVNKNLEYIGVNKPTIVLSTSSELFDAEKNNINFVNVIITSINKLNLKIANREMIDIDYSKIEIMNNIKGYEKSNYDDSWENYQPKGGSRFFSSLGLKIAMIKNSIITR